MKWGKNKFYLVYGLVALGLVALIGFLLFSGDQNGQKLAVAFNYTTETDKGLPQLEFRFEGSNLPARLATEKSFELNPPASGEFSWEGSVARFNFSAALQPNTRYTVSLRGGLPLINGQRSQYQGQSWQFTTPAARLLYLKRDGKAVNLWVALPDGSNSRQLTTETERQVLEYSLSPGGQKLVYALQEANVREVGLWKLDLAQPENPPQKLVSEVGVRATTPKWSPAGDIIVYERRLITNIGVTTAAQLWLVQANGTSLPPIYSGGERVGVNWQWAGDGASGIFWEPRREALGWFNFSGEPQWFPLKGVQPASFALHPSGSELVIARFDYSGATERIILMRLVRSNGDWQIAKDEVLKPGAKDDFNPVWSPDGSQLIFVRVESPEAGKALSTRLEVVLKNEKNSRVLAQAESGYNFGKVGYSGDGKAILVQKLKTSERISEIWVGRLDNNGTYNFIKLISDGYSPALA